MRTDLEILENHFPTPEGHEDTDRILAAMKEAREEYLKAFMEWQAEVRDENGNELERHDTDLWYWSVDTEGENPLRIEDLIELFNAHLAAQQGERGKG